MTGNSPTMVMAEMRKLGIVPIIDLLHFGLPDWLGDFQNPDWPNYFAEYARTFAERYPWVRVLHAGERDLRHRAVLAPRSAGGTSD